MGTWFHDWRVTRLRDRYVNCRFWHGSRWYAAWHALFVPSHANKNIAPNAEL